MAEVLGNAVLELGVDNAGLETGMAASEGTVNAAMIAIGAFVAQLAMQITGQLVDAAKQFIAAITTGAATYGSFIAQLQAQTGIGAAAIQKIGEAFSIGGISESQSSMMIKRFQDFVAKVQDGTKAYTESMAKMGLNTQQFMALDEEGKINAVMVALGKLTDKNQAAAIGTQMFGRTSQEMALIIQRWPEIMGKATDSMSHFGLSQEQIDNLEKSKEDMTQLQDATGMLGDKIGAELAPNIDRLELALIKLVERLMDWLEKNPQLIDDMKTWIDDLTKLVEWVIKFSDGIFHAIQTFIQLNEMVFSGGQIGVQALGAPATTAPGMAGGGIVTSPQLAMVGEAGPEAIIPLNQMQNFGGRSLSINVGNFMGDDMSLRQFARAVDGVLKEEGQRSVTPRVQSTFYSVGGHL